MRDLDIKKCLDDRVAAGALSRAMANEAYRKITALQREYAREMAPDQALAAAQAETARILKQAAEDKKFYTQRQILAQSDAVRDVEAHPTSMAAGAMSLLGKDMRGLATWSNVETMAEVILGRMFRRVAEGLEKYRSKAAGLAQDKAGMRNVMRELYGENTGDAAAAAFAKGFRQAADYAVKRYRAAGNILNALENWRSPQISDPRRMREIGKAAWIEHMTDAQRRGAVEIIDFDTGAPLRPDDPRLQPMLDKSFDNMTREAGPFESGGAGGHNERRVFHWKTADAWLAYNDKFGVGDDIFAMLVGHMNGMARDIALTERLGPNHAATVRLIAQKLHENDKALGAAHLNPVRAVEGTDAFIRTYDMLSGRLGRAHSEFVAALGGGVRSFLTMTQLGSAMISAVPSDMVTATLAARANGIPAVKMMATALAQMNPANEADRAFALRMGIVTHAVMDSALMSKRFGDEIVGEGVMGKMASFVIRAQGLSAWTNGMKNAFMLEKMGLLADEAGKPMAQVAKPLQDTLRRYGFTDAEWDALRTAAPVEYKGAKFFDPGAVADEKLADKLMSMVVTERQYAVMEPDARVRQLTTGGTQRGTVLGEAVRSATLFKSFAVTMLTTVIARTHWGDGHAIGKIGRAAGVAMLLTTAGALSIQTRQIATGKDPRRMDTPEFWGAAFMQGGALGVFGDFLSAGYSRGDNGFLATLAGPVATLTEDVAKLTLPQIRRWADGEDSTFGTQAARMVKKYTPGNNFLYTRLATDRLIFDEIMEMLDPQYRKSFRRMEERARKDYDQEYWSRPGQGLAPQRAPDLGAALGR